MADIRRALKDKDYFNSLSEEEKAEVRAANPAGDVELTDEDLDSVSGGLEGVAAGIETTTTTDGTCECKDTQEISAMDCACGCDPNN